LEWIVQQLRWEVTLAELHTPTTVDEAA